MAKYKTDEQAFASKRYSPFRCPLCSQWVRWVILGDIANGDVPQLYGEKNNWGNHPFHIRFGTLRQRYRQGGPVASAATEVGDGPLGRSELRQAILEHLGALHQ